MIIVSDYSGQHKVATHEAYSFLVTTDRALGEWKGASSRVPRSGLAPRRAPHIIQTAQGANAVASADPFLDAASAIRGNVITFLVDRRIRSFMSGGAGAIAEAFPDCFSPETKPGTIEKMLRLSSFVAMLIAGLRQEKQRSLWISDHDEALATFDRGEQFGRLCSYLTFGSDSLQSPADLEFGTTESPWHALAWAEDAASISDLIAGACFCSLVACCQRTAVQKYGSVRCRRSPRKTAAHVRSAIGWRQQTIVFTMFYCAWNSVTKGSPILLLNSSRARVIAPFYHLSKSPAIEDHRRVQGPASGFC